MDAASIPRAGHAEAPDSAAPGVTAPAAPARRLGSLLAPPLWLRDLGTTAWLGVGVALMTVAAVWLLSLTQTIVMPVIAAGVMAAVTSPLVDWLARHHVGRGLGGALVLLGFLALTVLTVLLITRGLMSESGKLDGTFAAAKDDIAGWLRDAGVSDGEARSAVSTASGGVQAAVPALIGGVLQGIGALSSAVVFLSLMALALLFLLKDGPSIRTWAERHAAMPEELAHLMVGRVLQSLRGYFVGVTAVAVFNAVVVGLGALALGVPLPGTIAIVTFLGAYVPYLGAWSAGAFAVLLAIGGAGHQEAMAMAVICLLANGLLQQLVQPIAYGAALGIHPLVVLIVTIAGGSLFGAAGLILAAPITSALTRIAGDLAALRAPEEQAAAETGTSTPAGA
jgi:predicted PurR-regulated permease PerM